MTITYRSLRANRQLVLVDIENLAGTATPTAHEVRVVIAALSKVVPGYSDAQRIVACSHRAAPAVSFESPTDRRLWRSGPDGADLALLDVLLTERVEQRYERVTICSGDGIFAGAAAWLASYGVDVTVVSLAGHLAARLNLAAGHVIYLAPDAPIATGDAS